MLQAVVLYPRVTMNLPLVPKLFENECRQILLLDLYVTRCILALDCIKYVWNVGILVRNAAVLGFDGIYYVDGTADPFNWKVMVSAEMCLVEFRWPSVTVAATPLCPKKRWFW